MSTAMSLDTEVIRNPYLNDFLGIGFLYTLGLPVMGYFAMQRYRKRLSEQSSG